MNRQLLLAVAHDLHMWHGDLEKKLHSPWDLLEYLAGCELRARYGRQRAADQEATATLRAEGMATLALMP